MLHALELENFKAFGKRARIPFAPITLIFGENSAGKSTILQALYLLKQTLESRESDAPLLPRTENGIVDLGSFQEMIFDHDLERTLSIRVETTSDSLYSLQVPSYRRNSAAIEFSFKRPPPEAEVYLDQIGIYYPESGECIAKFQPLDTTEESEVFLRGMSFSRPLSGIPSSRLTAMKCVWLTAEPEYWKLEFEWHKQKKEGILSELREMLIELQHANDQHKEDNKRFQQECRYLNDDIEFFSLDFDLETYISKRQNKEVNAAGIGVYSFFPFEVIVPPYKWEFRSYLHRRSNDIAFSAPKLALAAGRALELDLVYLFPISPFRRPPERLYIFRGTSPQDVGYRGDLLPDLLLRRPELVKDTNEWLNRLNMDYELEVKPVGTDTGDLFQVRLMDTRRKEPISVALPDVGFGVSQLLPFIVQSLVSEGRIISIEQPEVHVHPKLQADLGDLLAEAIKEPRQNRFIIETHSEHLILRLQRLVRQKQIEPEDVSVIYVSRGPEGAKAERLRLDDEGDFIDEWPNGFFLERLREL